MRIATDIVNPFQGKWIGVTVVFCGSGFPAAIIEAESLSHENRFHDIARWRCTPYSLSRKSSGGISNEPVLLVPGHEKLHRVPLL
jgi:hypothetical protein